jgi:hypothetical protein
MSIDVNELPGATVTRRRVVETGIKLAYAAPLVAASYKIGSGAAVALSPTCSAGTCDAPNFCESDDTCACRTVGGAAQCLQNEFCVAVAQCSSDAECPGGFCFPATDNCCGETGLGRCVFPCGVHPAGGEVIGDTTGLRSTLGI